MSVPLSVPRSVSVRVRVRGGGREVNGVTSKIAGLEGLKERGYLRGDKGDINLRMIALER